MKEYILFVLCMSILNQAFPQSSKIFGQYNLTKTNETPGDWVSLKGTAVIKNNGNGSVNITGNFLIQTTQTTSLKANFNSENCIVPKDKNIESYSATGDIFITHSDGAGSERDIKVVRIIVDFKKQDIRIFETNPSDWRLGSWQRWVKGPSS
jgi:hypothetical protein